MLCFANAVGKEISPLTVWMRITAAHTLYFQKILNMIDI
jgi:hypothetical protein